MTRSMCRCPLYRVRWPVLACGNVFILPGVPELFRRKFEGIRERFRVAPFYTRVIYTLEDEFDIAGRLREVADQHPHVLISPCIVVGGEGLARCRMRIGGGLEDKIRVVRRSMNHHGPRHAEADNP